MELKDFIAHFAAQLEETDIAILTPQTHFRDLVE
jgi:hypothetical protein